MEIFSFHLMPWPYLPDDYTGSAWITCPNELYDPVKGHALLNRYLDELEYAAELGFDGVALNEHHQTAYGGMPSPNVAAGMLARRTERTKIAVIGNGLPLYNPPLRVAEEYAMLDVVTGGRLVAGMVVAGGPEYYAYGVNPAEARRRFAEAVDLIIQAWTRPGPFSFEGEFYRLRYVNPWPRPLQQPHPDVWIPGAGSIETMEMVASRGFGYCGIPFFARTFVEQNYQLFRRTWLEHGRDPAPEKLGLLIPIYVAETDEQARTEFEQHLWYFVRRLISGVEISPPGYMTPKSIMRMMGVSGGLLSSAKTWDDVEAGEFVIIGSPETVTARLTDRLGSLGAGKLFGIFQFGTLPAELTRQNLTLFADEVMPRLRAEFPAGPEWAEQSRPAIVGGAP